MKRLFNGYAYLLLSLVLTPSVQSFASLAHTHFNVSGSVAATCSVSAKNLNFPVFVPTNGQGVTQTNTISVECTKGASYQVGLLPQEGPNPLLKNGNYALSYGLYKDPNFSQPLQANGYTGYFNGQGTGSTQHQTVYGLIPNIPFNRSAPPGFYYDIVTVIINLT